MLTINDVNKIILEAKSVKKHKYMAYLNRVAELLISFEDVNCEREEALQIILDPNNPLKKQFIAVVLLMIYEENEDIINNDNTIKIKVVKLFDKYLFDIYKHLEIKEGMQNYEKLCKLKAYIVNIKENIKNDKINIYSLNDFNEFKNKILKTSNIYKKNILIKYFVSDYLHAINIEKLLSLVNEYIQSKNNDKVTVYIKIEAWYKEAENCYKEYSNTFINDIFLLPLQSLEKIIKKDYDNSIYSKKAKLVLSTINKKYPFHLVNHCLSVGVEISNLGEGAAFKVRIKVLENSDEIEFITKELSIVMVENRPLKREFQIRVDNSVKDLIANFELIWSNSDSTTDSQPFLLEFIGQDSSINWDELQFKDPYSLEAVDNENDLIGRTEIIDLLMTKANQKMVSSQYIFGQRRVGKTSIAKTFLTKSKGLLNIIYIEAGDWSDLSSPERSINNLCTKICYKIQKQHKMYENIKVPKFEGSFSRLTDYFDSINEIDSNYKLLIILDEFDRISNQLFSRGEIGKAFMLTIRAISNRPNYGFLLIGGEKLELILAQWQELNKFERIRVDYFDNSRDWEDFRNLVKIPLGDKFEYTEEAIEEIYKQTAGNPYYTKLLCSKIFNFMKERKDNFITQDDVIKSLEVAIRGIGAPSFSHFWEDGIKEDNQKEEEISIARRKLLLAIRDVLVLNPENKINKEIVLNKAIEKGLIPETVLSIFDEFIQRKILADSTGVYSFVMDLFRRWLIHVGYEQIIPSFKESEIIKQSKFHEENLRIKSTEIENVVSKWGPYKSTPITLEKTQKWLTQFGKPSKQRLIFSLLEKLKFYNDQNIRTILEAIYDEINRIAGKMKYVRILEPQKKNHEYTRRKRDDILVSYIDHFGKSGSEYAKKFADLNDIYIDLVCDFNSISDKLLNNSSIKLIVFIDDIAATGDTFKENLNELNEIHGDLIREKNILIFIGLITGFLKAKYKIEEYLESIKINGEVIIMDAMDEKNKCFSDSSEYIKDMHERILTRELCNEIGLKLEKKHPLGYNDCQLAIVFPNTCPNNSLPIFWKKTKEWEPLFERT